MSYSQDLITFYKLYLLITIIKVKGVGEYLNLFCIQLKLSVSLQVFKYIQTELLTVSIMP